MYNCIWKTILNRDGLLAYDIVYYYVFYDFIDNMVGWINLCRRQQKQCICIS